MNLVLGFWLVLFQYLLVLLLQIIETTLILFFNPVNLLRKHILLVHVAGKLFLVFFPDSLNIVISQSLQFFQVLFLIFDLLIFLLHIFNLSYEWPLFLFFFSNKLQLHVFYSLIELLFQKFNVLLIPFVFSEYFFQTLTVNFNQIVVSQGFRILWCRRFPPL